MKTTLLSIAFALSIMLPAQTASDFTADDCAGSSHNLFSELNSGKVIVIAWVMPCAGCLAPSQTAYNIVQGYATSNPGQVLMYVVDDYGNSSCNTINNWVNNNNMPNVTTFSDATIDMTAYGGVGMPKIIVVGGGYSHGLYFNANNSASNDATGIQNAIDSALADVTGIADPAATSGIKIYPNPAIDNTVITLNAIQKQQVTIELFNSLGQKVMSIFNDEVMPGETRVQFSVAGLAEGVYCLRITEGNVTREEKLTVTN